jgi:hypothetical protein
VCGTLRIKIEAYAGGELLGRDSSDGDFAVRLADYIDPCFPNPFNGSISVPYSIDSAGTVTVSIYDVAGRLVRILYQDRREPGIYEAEWDGCDAAGKRLSSGVYFCTIATEDFTGTQKIVFVK